jgi:hypothetical protein
MAGCLSFEVLKNVLKQEWQIDLNLFLHHWLKDYEVVKA